MKQIHKVMGGILFVAVIVLLVVIVSGTTTLQFGGVLQDPTEVAALAAAPLAGNVTIRGEETTTSFAYAVCDSLKLNVESLHFDDVRAIAVPTNREIQVVGDDAASNFKATVIAPTKKYTSATVKFTKDWTLKAYARTATKLVYTSATGVKTAAVDAELPSDYAEYTYDVGYMTTSHISGTTVTPFTLTKSSVVSVLVDPSYCITAYDGERGESLYGSMPGALPPYTWDIPENQPESFFDPTLPHFAMATLPIFVWVGKKNDTPPIAETYAMSMSSETLSTPEINYGTQDDSRVFLISNIFGTTAGKDKDKLLSMRARNLADQEIQEYLPYGDRKPDSSYQVIGADKRILADGSVTVPVSDEIVTFKRSTAGDALTNGTVENGPKCLKAIEDGNTAVSNKCIDDPSGGFDIFSRRVTG